MAITLPVLTFHAIDDASSVISFPPRVFAQGMAMLHASGYRAVSLGEAVRCLRANGSFPDRAFVLTFDDGFETVYTEAFPVLQRYGMSATVFLIAGDGRAPQTSSRLPTFEGRSMLSWSEIRSMRTMGIDFGAHTLTHPDLTRMPSEQIAVEMSVSKAVIEDALGTAVTAFAYPFGRYNATSRGIAEQYFSCACADTLGLLGRGSDPYALERVDGYYVRTTRLFGLMVKRLFPWYVAGRSVPRRLRRSMQGALGQMRRTPP